MTRNSPPGHAQNSVPASLEGWHPGPVQDLTRLLLHRLLDENTGTSYARAMVRAAEPSGSWEISVPDGAKLAQPQDGDDRVEVTTALDDGRTLILTTGPATDHDAETRTAQRYLTALRTVLDLGLRMHSQRQRAQAAVDAVEGMALLDLATGIVMARRGTDPQTARDALAAWSRRTGTPVNGLTADTMLELLTGEEFQPG